MIQYTRGNLLHSDAEALVNAVNELGIMGKGIALAFREAFPASSASYIAAARRQEVRVGRVLVTESPRRPGPTWIIHVPTKRHWRNPSQLEWIADGLADLATVVAKRGIRSIALPALGCGNGGLAWTDVHPLIEGFAASVPDVDVRVYLPGVLPPDSPSTQP